MSNMYLLFVNKLGSLLMVRLSLRSNFPQALALLVSCHLISLPLSCPIQPLLCWGDTKGSANTLVRFHVSGGISEAFGFVHWAQSRV